MSTGAPFTILFRVAAGPRMGFGHLVRCRSLARALGVTPLVSIRGTQRTRDFAAAGGWRVAGRASLAAADAIVIDDPVAEHAAAWVRQARRLGLPVASIHDLGRAHVASDLVVDGTIGGHGDLRGPRFAILDPSVAALRREPRRPVTGRVLIALGGGSHVLSLAARLSSAVAARSPQADIRVVRGFVPGRQAPELRHATWIDAPDGLGRELAEAEAAVVAGGVTLYEACALGAPVVALPVTAAQHQTVRAAACRGAAIDTGRPPVDDCMVSRAADAVAALLQNRGLRRRQSAAARQLVDGQGVFRVADRLRQLIDPARAGHRGARHAA